MYSFFFAAGLFALPLLIFRVKTCRRGLLTGLFISLFFWGNLNPLLCTVSLSAALYLYFSEGRRNPVQKEKLYVLNPSFPMLVFFMTAVTCIFSLHQVMFEYGAYLTLDERILSICRALTFPAWLTGSLLCGLYCDKKGPYRTATALTLLTEAAVLLASFGAQIPAFFITGFLLLELCVSAFFVLIPLLTYGFLGKYNFFRLYPLMCLFCLILLSILRYGQRKIDTSVNPAAPLLTLTLLAFTAACFLYTVWKKRFVIVAPLPKKI